MASRWNRHPAEAAFVIALMAIGVWAQGARGATTAWEPLGPDQVVNLVVADPQDPRMLYAGTALGVYRSRDGGQTWTRLTGALPGQNVLSLVVDPTVEDKLYAGSNQGLYSTEDGGSTWEQVESVGSGILSLATGPPGSGLVCAGTFGRGVFSLAGGDSIWQNSDATLTNGVVYDLAVSPLDASTVYAGTADGLFASSDGGHAWHRLGEELAGESVRSIYLPPAPDGDLIVLGTFGSGVVRSEDRGISWVRLNQGLDPAQVRALAVVDDTFAGIMYAATSTGGFYRTRDAGQHWLPINHGLPELRARSVLLDPAASDRLLGTGPGTGVWEIRFAPEPQISAIPPELAFGSVPVGLQQTKDLDIANVGTADLVVTDVKVRGAAGFTVDFEGPLVIPSGERRSVAVGFAPPLRDLLLSDVLTISSNDLDEPSLRVPVTGIGTRSILNVVPASLDFGRVRVVPGLADTTLILRNTGSTPLTLLSASFDDAAFRVVTSWPAVLQAGESTALPVSFAPASPVSYAARLRLISDSTPDSLEVVVTGTGTAPEMGTSTSVLDFGQVDLGSESTLPLAVTNTGTAQLTIGSVRTSGGHFAVDRRPEAHGDTVYYTLASAETLQVRAGGGAPVIVPGPNVAAVEVRSDSTFIRFEPDTTVALAGGSSTLVIAGSDSTVFAASEDTTVIAPGRTHTFEVAFRPETSGPYIDTLAIVSDALSSFGLTHVLLRGEGNALSLRPADHIGIGLRPVDLAIADLDGDGAPDLAVVDSLSGELHVLLNDGGGGFPAGSRVSYPQTPAVYGRWAEPVAVVAASMHAAGPSDVVVGDRVARSLSILANDGHGGFGGGREDVFIGHALTDIQTADLDADGDEDLVVANGPGAQSITLLFGNGRGGVGDRAVVPVQRDPVAVAVGHVNADGHSDLVVANRAANTVTVLYNDRKGGFAERRHEGVGVSPEAVVLADIDADGDEDIVVANSGSRSVVCLRNSGDGEFTSGPILSTGLLPRGLAVAGLTPDIYNDLLVAGQGDFLVFYENSSGAQFDRQDMATGLGIHAVQIADLDDNRANDIIGLSYSPAGVQVYQGLAERLVPPRPPAQVEAVDVERDLGGAIRVTWQDGDYGTRPLEEQVIQTTRYIIVRSATPGFGLADTLGTVPGGQLSFVDRAATPYQTLYYQVTANRGDLTSAPSAPVMAASLPAPLVDLRPLNGPTASIGDTLRVQVFVTPAQHEIAGLSVFLTYEPEALQIIPDPVAADTSRGDTIRPIRVRLAGLAERVNAVHDSSGPGQLDLSLLAPPDSDPAVGPGGEAALVGEVWFLASKDTSTFIVIDDDPVRNRTTAVVEHGSGAWILPALGDTVRLSVRDHRVGGRLELESQDAPSAPVRATLLFLGAAGDTLLSPLNDEDRFEPGIQTTLDGSGHFVLAQIPPGTYRAFAKAPTHLQGSILADTVTIDTTRSDLQFKWVAGVGSAVRSPADSTVLPAGDANDDNRINLADFGLLVRYFGAATSTSEWRQARAADFNGSGAVEYDDFYRLAGNFGRVGMEPDGAAPRIVSHSGRWAAVHGEDLALTVVGLGPVSGFSLVVDGASPTPELTGTIWDGLDLRLHQWPEGERWRLAAALRDPRQAPVGEGALLHLMAKGDAQPRVQDVQFLDIEGRVFRASGASRPARAALGQNYPNPFNPQTVIPFEVPSLRGHDLTPARLVVYNLAGQRVRVLMDEPRLPGCHSVVWDGRDAGGFAVATGTYYYRLEIGTYRQTRRLLLLR